ncbi:MAG: zinc ribbon domain-containing protein [Anaerolineae bacterium]|nr:zinc ribbon domain-containing protein [Anaerolineae bacterium]
MNFDQTISQLLLFLAMATGAVVAATWLGMVLWTLRDIRARSRDVLAQGAATLMVAVLHVFGLILYLMLRPRETLAEAYERSLEEEALLQGIEEKPICPGCGRPSKEQWQVCPYCHTRLKKPCIQCNQLLDLPWNICPYCATPQGAAAEAEQPRQPSQRRSRRSDRGERARPTEEVTEGAQLEFIEGDDSL